MKTIYTSLPIYNKISKQRYQKVKSSGLDKIAPVVCPRHRLPSFQWMDGDDGVTVIDKVEMIGIEGEANLVTEWNNAASPSHYSTFVTDGPDITSAINAAGLGTSYCTTNYINVLYGMQYTITINITVAAGGAPDMHTSGTGTGTIYPSDHQLVDGENILTYMCVVSGTIRFLLYGDALDSFSATVTVTGYDITNRYWWDSGYNSLTISPTNNSSYDTLISNGGASPDITSAIKTVAAGVEYCYSDAFSVTTGDYIRFNFTLDLNSGTAPNCVLVDSADADKSNVVRLVHGLNSFVLISTVTDANCRIRFRNEDTELTNFSMLFCYAIKLTSTYIKPFALSTDSYYQYKGNTLTRLLPVGDYYLKLTTNAGYIYYSDWFKVDCVYENLLSNPVNVTYDTFTVSGNTISSAINAAGEAYSTSDVFQVIKGETITIIFWLTLNSGQVPTIYITPSPWGAIYVGEASAAGLNEITLTPSWTGDAYFRFYNSDASNFSTADIEVLRHYSEKYLTIDFHNDCDLGDILYQDGFTQTIWFESETMEPTFPQEEEGVKNGEDRFVRTFARQVKKYLVRTFEMPDFMVDVFNRMKLHESIELTDLDGDTNDVYNLEVDHEYTGDDKYYAKVELIFDYDEAVVIAGCCNDFI